MKYFEVHPPRNLPGGDYGAVLYSGQILDSMMDCNDSSYIYIYGRSIPFIPPIAVVSSDLVVITNDMKEHLVSRGISGCVFSRVVFGKAVSIDWTLWDEDNWKYPSDLFPSSGNDPDDYITQGDDCPNFRNNFGNFWNLSGAVDPNGKLDIFKIRANWPNLCCSQSAMHAILECPQVNIEFQPCM